MRERQGPNATFQFPSIRRRVTLFVAAVAAVIAIPFMLPSIRRTTRKLHAAWTYPEARDVVRQFAAAAARRDTSAIRRLTLSGSDSSTLCARAAWPQATWQFDEPRPRITFDGPMGDFLYFTVHSTAEGDRDQPVGLRVGIARDTPERVATFGPLPPLADVRGC
jgi:hypothetical protein